MIVSIAVGYLAGRLLYEKVLPVLFNLVDNWVEANRFFKGKPSKFDKHF